MTEEKEELLIQEEENEYSKELEKAKAKLNDASKVRINLDFADVDESLETDDEAISKEDEGKKYSDVMLLKLKMASDRVKKYYSDVRNELARFENLRFRSNKSGDVYLHKNKAIVRISVFSRALKVYFALNPRGIDKKYHTVNSKKVKKYESVPVMLRLSSDRSYKYFQEILEKLVKKYKLKDDGKEYNVNYINDLQANTQEIISLLGYDDLIMKKANLVSCDVLPNNVAKNAQVLVTNPYKDKEERVTYEVTVGELSAAFKSKYDITLDLLKKVGLAPSEANYLRVIAKGECHYPLRVTANDYELLALKLIIITGGNVIKYIN